MRLPPSPSANGGAGGCTTSARRHPTRRAARLAEWSSASGGSRGAVPVLRLGVRRRDLRGRRCVSAAVHDGSSSASTPPRLRVELTSGCTEWGGRCDTARLTGDACSARRAVAAGTRLPRKTRWSARRTHGCTSWTQGPLATLCPGAPAACAAPLHTAAGCHASSSHRRQDANNSPLERVRCPAAILHNGVRPLPGGCGDSRMARRPEWVQEQASGVRPTANCTAPGVQDAAEHP
jgi:hypothetical protein